MRNECSQINTWFFLNQFPEHFKSLVLMVNVMEWFYVSYNTCEEYKSKSGEQTIIMMSNTRELINVWQQRFHDGYWHCFFPFSNEIEFICFPIFKENYLCMNGNIISSQLQLKLKSLQTQRRQKCIYNFIW